MKKVFLDTNILLDVLLERHPFCQPAQKIWTDAERKNIKAAVSAISLNNTFFILKRLSSKEKACQAIQTISEIFKIIDLNSRIIQKALRAEFPDFEDALQYFSALRFGARAILSRDPSGFSKGKLPVLTCEEFLATP